MKKATRAELYIMLIEAEEKIEDFMIVATSNGDICSACFSADHEETCILFKIDKVLRP